MRAQALAQEAVTDWVDLESLDKFLRSDRAPHDCMMLSELDGFLTGLAIGPERVQPSEWLPIVWGGDAPEFADLDEADAIVGTILARQNEIVRDVARRELAPIYWTDRDDAVIAADWAVGFLRAIRVRITAWKPLFASKRDSEMLVPFLSLRRDADGKSVFAQTEAEKRILDCVPELIPGCVIRLADYWRRHASRPWDLFEYGLRYEPIRSALKVGRNEPCPCGSGKKFKRCCGQAG